MVQNRECELTIITPTYNRRDSIHNLYESLILQTNQNFQWLIIDDGSKDHTDEWFQSLPDTIFLKEYHYKENGGKHTALNASHEYIKGRYIVIVDSDDTLVVDAVETILQGWREYENNDQIALMIYKKKDRLTQKEMGIKTPKENMMISLVQAHNQGVKGDHCETARTECFIKYKFPEFPGERFIGEALMWLHISEGKKVVYINQIIYIGEYLAGGLTQDGRKMRIRNPLGGMVHAKPFLDQRFCLPLRIKNGLLFVCYGYFADWRIQEMLRETQQKKLVLLCAIPGWMIYWNWKKKYSG